MCHTLKKEMVGKLHRNIVSFIDCLTAYLEDLKQSCNSIKVLHAVWLCFSLHTNQIHRVSIEYFDFGFRFTYIFHSVQFSLTFQKISDLLNKKNHYLNHKHRFHTSLINLICILFLADGRHRCNCSSKKTDRK